MPFGVKSIGVSSLRRPTSVVQLVEQAADRAGANVHEFFAGDGFELGQVSIRVIWPPAPVESALALSSVPENDASLVFLVDQPLPDTKRRFTTLVTGDIEQVAQSALARTWVSPAIDVYKVPHHGSVVQDERLPGLTQARTAIISVGADNTFGHPHQKTLELLARAQMKVSRTDTSGDIALSWRQDQVVVTTRR
jgi:competence protein ComEC